MTTPETDAEVVRINYGHDMVTGDFARKLERQRDALAEALRLLIIEVVANCQHANFMSDETGEALNKANAALTVLEGKS